MRKIIVSFLILVLVVSSIATVAFASTKQVYISVTSTIDTVRYGSTTVLDGEEGVVSGEKSVALNNDLMIFQNTYRLSYDDDSIIFWGGKSYDIVIEEPVFKVSVPYNDTYYNYAFGENYSQCLVQLYLKYADGTGEVVQNYTYLSDLNNTKNRINGIVFNPDDGSHLLFLNISSNKDIRAVYIYEYMRVGESLKAAGVPSGSYNVMAFSGFSDPLKVSIEEEHYTATFIPEINDKLDDVVTEQESTNDKLDNIINGEVDIEPPSGGGIIGDLDDAEAGLRGDASDGLGQGLQIQQNAFDIITEYFTSFAAFGLIFNKFANIPFFSGLLYSSLALGIYGAILGVFSSIGSAARSEARSAQREKRFAEHSTRYKN